MKIRQIRNATLIVNYAGTRFLIDHKEDYVFGWIPYRGHSALRDQRLPLFVRRDRVPFARFFHAVEQQP